MTGLSKADASDSIRITKEAGTALSPNSGDQTTNKRDHINQASAIGSRTYSRGERRRDDRLTSLLIENVAQQLTALP